MSVRPRQGIRRRRWSAKEFYRLLDLGFFNGQRVQLIEGEILQMAAQKNFHALGIKLTEDALNAVFGPNFWVRVQMSLDLTPYSVPDPDLAVIPGSPRANATLTNPTTALLIVEVSLTTLYFDRRVKSSLYAKVGIEDYWVLNLVQRQLEIRRKPVPDSSQRYGFSYLNETIFVPGDVVTPLAAAQSRIAVADLLP